MLRDDGDEAFMEVGLFFGKQIPETPEGYWTRVVVVVALHCERSETGWLESLFLYSYCWSVEQDLLNDQRMRVNRWIWIYAVGLRNPRQRKLEIVV